MQLTAEDVDMDPEAWLAAQPNTGTTLDFDFPEGEEDLPKKEGGNPSLSANLQKGAEKKAGLGRASRDAAIVKSTVPVPATASATAADSISAKDFNSTANVDGGGDGGSEQKELDLVRASQMQDVGGDGLEGEEEEGEEEEEKLVVCQRCFKLRNYGSVEESLRPGFSDSDLLTPQRFLVSTTINSVIYLYFFVVVVVLCFVLVFLFSVFMFLVLLTGTFLGA